jgi:hypothetical protein
MEMRVIPAKPLQLGQILKVRILAAELLVAVFAFGCRTDPYVNRSYTARVTDVLDELKKAIALRFQMGAKHIILSI